ncbi:hypothetical protein [Streptomyces sp. NPDC046979]|uniref:hypothetical protein n=1 Tax=Streptomyces sp. NPDC046979 TaxID=3154604 RepID=UPI0033C1740E
MVSDGAVVDEAVRAAWDSYRSLSGVRRTRSARQQRVQAVREACGREQVSRGAVFLVGVMTAHIVGAQEGAGQNRLDPLSDLIPAVLRRLPDFELAEPD